ALDPQTTASILELLKEINRTLGITIVIITHQMSVIREICTHVAIVDKGTIVEQGYVEGIFAHPKSQAARELIFKDGQAEEYQGTGGQRSILAADRKIRIVFSENSAFEPVIANMVLQFKTPVNILRADTKNVGGVAKGEMILGLPENAVLQEEMIRYLGEKGLAIEEVADDVE
ncbi:MAG: NIL domain-containing protein, partial [Clostridiales bacterium]|nr:NIL domain-containing protein [Clostridiales bacterium]